MAFLRYLLHGSDVLVMPKSWLENRERLRQYEGYTRRQLQQGSVVSDVAATRRKAFWEAIAGKAQRSAPVKVAQFGRGRS